MAVPFIQVIPQRHKMDCGVACLAMLLGISYEAALMAFQHNVLTQGTTIRQLVNAGQRLNVKLHWTRKVDMEEDTGLLMVRSLRWGNDHMVVLKEDFIVDTDSSLWNAQDFMGAYEATVLSIVKKED